MAEGKEKAARGESDGKGKVIAANYQKVAYES